MEFYANDRRSADWAAVISAAGSGGTRAGVEMTDEVNLRTVGVPPLMTRKGDVMAGRPRLSTEVCDDTEAANTAAATALAYWESCWADEVINQQEAAGIVVRLLRTVSTTRSADLVTADLDHAVAESIAVLHGGDESPRAQRLRGEREKLHLIRGGGGDEPAPSGPAAAKKAA